MYDREGDLHYDTLSAFIKSIRGSDVDAALYWLARMVEGGEDPRLLMRRLLVLAAEDIGLADPRALEQVAAAAFALNWVGLPEGQFHLAQATIYSGPGPKSNSTLAYFRAKAALREKGITPGAHPLTRCPPGPQGPGARRGYRYPHDYPGHYVEQDYLPEELAGATFYEPARKGRSRSWPRAGGPGGKTGTAPEDPEPGGRRTDHCKRRSPSGALTLCFHYTFISFRRF